MQAGAFSAGAPTSGFSFGAKPTGFGTFGTFGSGSTSAGGTTFGGGFGAKPSMEFGSLAGQAQNTTQQSEMARVINTIGAGVFATVLEKAYLPTESDTCLFKANFKSAGLKLDKPLPTTTATSGTLGSSGTLGFGTKPGGFGGFGGGGVLGQSGGSGFGFGLGFQQKPAQGKSDANEVVGIEGLVTRANTHTAKLSELKDGLSSPSAYNFDERLNDLVNHSNVISSLLSQCTSLYGAISFKLMKIIEEREYGCSNPAQRKAILSAATQLGDMVEGTTRELVTLSSMRSGFGDFNTLWMTLDSRTTADLRAFIAQELEFLEQLRVKLVHKRAESDAAPSDNLSISHLT
ncbi:hypothetical protein GL50803_0014400 [Giardia duodenalis]|uniref:Uncharacterized protein n=1 Tax=Giardia intestinalis (strain ATCC 50803 / WB clone C6) TaxID=184922 RepID=D3KGH1_GIAIC|nr:hypothetical protein GL50803_0014400 [Giardia intestinalis]KAE8301761.1 hypothetical protein GL50803_0014400 [Giardia intestinalis]